MAKDSVQLLQGTLDLIVLQALSSMGPLHAYALAARLEQMSDAPFSINQGTLYPALVRLEQRGHVKGAWRKTATVRGRACGRDHHVCRSLARRRANCRPLRCGSGPFTRRGARDRRLTGLANGRTGKTFSDVEPLGARPVGQRRPLSRFTSPDQTTTLTIKRGLSASHSTRDVQTRRP